MNEPLSSTPPITHVVLVGHCGFDSPGLGRWSKQHLPDAEVAGVNRQADLDPYLHGRSLLLINRVLDGRFEHDAGLDMIEAYAAREDPPRMMLVSNYPEAQAKAVEAGARPGVGKSELGRPEAGQRLLDATTL